MLSDIGFRAWRTALAGAVAILSSAHLAAQMPPFSADRMGSTQLQLCLSRAPSEVKKTDCLAQEAVRRDRQLTQLFAEYVRDASLKERQQMMLAQSAWTRFRKENCAVRRLNPGSGMGSFYYGCLVRETNTRIAELHNGWDY